MKIAFRVDASEVIGIGHLMRCLALTEELKKRGNSCIFLSKYDNGIIHKIKEFNVDFYKIKSSDSQEINEVLNFLKEKKIDWVITDSYKVNTEYIKKIKNKGFNVLSIDDMAIIHYYSDIVVNQNIGAEKLDFSAENYTKFLLGPKFAILRDELLEREYKIETNAVEKILVTMGGAYLNNFTLKILKILKPVDENIEFLVVVGPFNRSYEDIKTYIKKTKSNVKLIRSPEKMAEIYLNSDLAISAGGTSCYELAYFGIPNIIITVADNQIKIAKELDLEKISMYLGQMKGVSAEKLKEAVRELINNQTLRKIMSQNGRKMVDGNGKKRIVDFMESSY